MPGPKFKTHNRVEMHHIEEAGAVLDNLEVQGYEIVSVQFVQHRWRVEYGDGWTFNTMVCIHARRRIEQP